MSIIVVSSDLPEVLAISDRVVVLKEGRISGGFRPSGRQPGTRDAGSDGLNPARQRNIRNSNISSNGA